MSRIFPVYFGLQLGWGGVALFMAIHLAHTAEGRVHRWRAILCALAVATVGLGWWLETVVSDLRKPREQLTDEVLKANVPAQSR